MKKIKILYALESAGGGTLKHVTYLATRLNQDEFDITVVIPSEYYEADTQENVIRMRQKGVCVDTVFMPKCMSLNNFRALFHVCAYLRKNSFDIIHAHSSIAGALFRLATYFNHVPVTVYTPHCFYFVAHTGYKQRFYAWIERMLAKKTHAIVISGTEQTVLNRVRIRPISDVYIINNAIDPDEYPRVNDQQMRYIWNIPENHKVVIGVGRLVKQKNWDRFIEVARMVLQQEKNVTFVIAGTGPLLKYLNEWVCLSGISDHVRICGQVDNIGKLYSTADVFMATSLWEGLPYTYLEAFHFNRPMLITHTEGIEYFIEQTGITCVPQNDTYRLRKELVKLISGYPLNTKSYTGNSFLFQHFIEQHQELYRRLFQFGFK
jgi:glycosyltransferase involved in cell wall biosynthesis